MKESVNIMPSNYKYEPWSPSTERLTEGILSDMLHNVKSNKSRVTVFMLNGFQLKGTVLDYSKECIVLEDKDGKTNFILVTAISTVRPD